MIVRKLLTSKPVIAAVAIIVAIVVVITVIWPLLASKPLRIYVTASLANGSTVVISDSGAGAFSVVTYNGQVVSAFHFYTTFVASAGGSGYTQYTLTGTNNIGNILLSRAGTTCRQITLPAQTTVFTFGTTYNLGDYTTTGSGTPRSVVDVPSTDIINASLTCGGDSTYHLVYSISITAQAMGTGTLPTSKWSGTSDLTIVVGTGTMTLSGSNTFTTSS